MVRLLPFLLLSLTLLTAACGKEETKPTAPLEGTWQWQRATDTYYNGNNQLQSTTPHSWQPGTYTLIITGQTIQNIDHRSQYTLTSPYTRQDNTILYTGTGQRVTITELTEHTLTLHHAGEFTAPTSGSFGGRTDTDVYYTR